MLHSVIQGRRILDSYEERITYCQMYFSRQKGRREELWCIKQKYPWSLLHIKFAAVDRQKRSGKMKNCLVTYVGESDRLFDEYSAVGGSDREIAFPVDEARGMNNILSISFVLTMINEGKGGAFAKSQWRERMIYKVV